MGVSRLLLLCALVGLAFCNREQKIKDILESVRRIEEHLSKEDRLWMITNVTRIDFKVDNLNSKVERMLSILEGAPTGRSEGSSTSTSTDLEFIQGKLQNLEASVSNVEESMKKLNFDPTAVNEIERRTTQLKDDMNTKLRKMMNVMTALYELNKDMKTNAESRTDLGESSRGKESTSGHQTEFFMENLEEMERKIKEQLSVLSTEIRSEISGLKMVASSVCQNTPQEDDDEEGWMTPRNDNARRNQGGRSSGNTMDNLIESLGRSTREIREDIQAGMQGIDIKLQNLTVLTHAHQECGSEPETSESVLSSRRSQVPPAQDVKPQSAEDRRKGKSSERCTKVPQNVPNPKSCADLRRGGATCDGIYVIFPKGVRAVRVLCDMTTDGGGWTILMRRGDYEDKMTSFNRNWLSYKNGFGDTEGEFWLGNDVIHHLTTEDPPNVLRIHMVAFDGDEIDLDYSSFSVANESSHYRSSLGPAMGPPSIASNGFRYHSNRPFSTFDKKHDRSPMNCAVQYKGGWWFNGCYQGFLTGEYFKEGDSRDDSQGILWYDWKKNEALSGAQMMLRPSNFQVN